MFLGLSFHRAEVTAEDTAIIEPPSKPGGFADRNMMKYGEVN